MATDKPRFTITVSDEMLADIAQYQETNQIGSRSGAIQELIEKGIELLVEKGVIAPTKNSPAISDEAIKIAKQYDSLNARDKKIVNAVFKAMSGKEKSTDLHIVQQAARGGKYNEEALTADEERKRFEDFKSQPDADDL